MIKGQSIFRKPARAPATANASLPPGVPPECAGLPMTTLFTEIGTGRVVHRHLPDGWTQGDYIKLLLQEAFSAGLFMLEELQARSATEKGGG